jgi:hypothetical protein
MHMSGDFVYCHALGWLRNQDPSIDFSLISNSAAWEALNKESCAGLQRKFRFTDQEITLGKHIDDQNWIYQGPSRNLVLHGYHKCLLGHGSEEMAYCATLGCLLPNNTVGHGPDCDAVGEEDIGALTGLRALLNGR